jgi:rhamnogalacturonyl hydrolase YesR
MDAPAYSVFGTRSVPPGPLAAGTNIGNLYAITDKVIQMKDPNSRTFVVDGAVGDPASLGVPMLFANWTGAKGGDYATAINQQLDYLLHDAPRSDDGAISHRSDVVQLWADFIYMAPPFIAYYGALARDSTLLETAYNQIALYHSALSPASDNSPLWRHVVGGAWEDPVHWATGNAWVAAGILRVLETIARSSFQPSFTDQQTQLVVWAYNITSAAWSYQQTNGTLLNVLDDPASFADSSSTALMAAVTYRLASIIPQAIRLVPYADKARKLIGASIDANGWLTQVVDPYAFSKPGTTSPEGQAFVLLMEAAHRDFLENGSDPIHGVLGGLWVKPA